MNRDDVIRMVREAGFKPEFFSPEGIDKWEHFAQLVAAAEREKVAQMFDGKFWAYDYREIAAGIRARGIKNED
jgi:hypothetical protein